VTAAIDAPLPRLLPDAAGAFTLDADMLAARFGWPAAEMEELIRRGMVASLVERGEGEDAGRWRLSVRCGNRRWRAVVDAEGTILDQQVTIVPPQMTGPATQGAARGPRPTR
jgi:hypothetical protein